MSNPRCKKKMIEFDNGNLMSIKCEYIVYKGYEFKTPVNLITLMAYDYLIEQILTGNIFKPE